MIQTVADIICIQIARAAAVFNIDEVVVFDESGSTGWVAVGNPLLTIRKNLTLYP